MAHPLMSEFNETVWFDKWKFEEAERKYAETLPRTKVIRFSESDSHQIDATATKKPWFTTDLRQMARKKQRLFRKARKMNTDDCWEEFKEFRSMFQSNVKHARLVYKYGPDYQTKRPRRPRNRSKSNSFSDDASDRRRRRTNSNGSKAPRTYISGRKPSHERYDKKHQGPNTQNEILNRMQSLENQTQQLKEVTNELHKTIQVMAKEMKVLVNVVTQKIQGDDAKDNSQRKKSVEESDDDIDDDNLSDDEDLFGTSDEEEAAEKEKLHKERVAAYQTKKATKAVVIAKSNVILDVKPWDDETNMTEVTSLVKEIKIDGLLWGASKLVPLAYGIKKLQISCVVEDDKVSIDDLQERICAFEDHVQSVDIAAFNKV